MILSPVHESFADASRWAEAGWFLARLTLIAVLGHLVLMVLARAAASRRHLAAVVTLAAMVALPVAVSLLPAWRLAILPPRAEVQSAVSAPRAKTVAIARDAEREAPLGGMVRRAASRTDAAQPLARMLASAPLTMASTSAPPVAATAASAPRPLRIAWLAVALVAVMVGALAGTTLVLLRFAVAMARAGRLARLAEPVEDAMTLGAFAWARERIGVRTPVRLARAAGVAVPIVAGIVRPVLLLPPASRSWSVERLRVVFLHELAHVRRGDAAALVLGRLATALFWFHPLAWSLARDARRESERACDDMVLASGVRASEYADQLLRIGALGQGHDRLAVATLAVARRSSLEVRLVSILRADARRGPATRPVVAVAIAAAALLLIPIVSVRVVAAPGTADRTVRTTSTKSTMSTTTRTVTTRNTVSSLQTTCEEPCAASEVGSGAESCTEARSCPDGWAEAAARAAAAAATWAQAAQAQTEAYAQAQAQWQPASQANSYAQLAGYKSGDGLYSEARGLYEAKHFAEAGNTYREAALAGHRPAISFYNAACSYALDGQTGPALSALAEARDAGFEDANLMSSDSDLSSIRNDHRFQLILLALRHTDKAEAEMRGLEAQYKAMKQAGSKDAGEWKSIGMTLMRSGKSELAADAFEREHQIDHTASALYNRACAFAIGGDREKALDALESSILAGFGDDEHVAEDADLASLHDDPRFRPLVQLTRDLALYGNGIDDDDRSTWQAALPRFERVTRERPQVGRAWFNLGFARLRCADVAGSRQAFTRALELQHRPATTMYNLGCVEAQAKNRDAAMQWLKKAEDAGMEMENTIFNDKDLDPLRSDPRFQSMVARVREQMAEKKRVAKD